MAYDASGLPFGLLAGLGPGSVVAGYQIEDRLGVGGMAVVFRARDVRLGRMVALKVLAPALAADDEFRTRFIREWRAATAVEHPHIIPVYAADEAGDVLYIAMRLVSGGDLRTLVRREGPLDARRAAGIVSAVAAALDAAHAVGLVHRDVKPGNILIDTVAGLADHVYLSDFGLSKGVMSSAGLTGTGQFLGTPDFAAPEQIAGKRVDARADQYALACVAFTLLTGRPVFPRDDSMAVMFAHVQDPPPSAAELRPGLPPAVDQVMARALAKSPGDRYPSCGEFAAALRSALPAPGDGPGLDRQALPGVPGGLRDKGGGHSFSGTHDMPSPGLRSRTVSAGWRPRSSQNATSATPTPTPTPSTEAHDKPTRRGSRRAVTAAAAALVLVAGGITAAVLMNSDNGSVGGRTPPAAGTSSPPAATTTSPRKETASPGATAEELSSGWIVEGALAFRGNDNLVGVSSNGPVYDWNLAAPHDAPSQFAGPTNAVLSANGALLYGDSGQSPERIWDTASGRETALPSSFGLVTGAISDTGDVAMLRGPIGGISLWNADMGNTAETLAAPTSETIDSVAISPDGSTVAGSDGTGTTYIWDAQTGAVTATLTNPGAVSPGAESIISDDGSTLGIEGNSSMYFWDLSNRTLVGNLHAHVNGSFSGMFLALSANGKIAAVTNDSDTAVNLVDIASGKVTQTLPDPSGVLADSPCVAAFNGDDTKLAVSCGTVTDIWNIAA